MTHHRAGRRKSGDRYAMVPLPVLRSTAVTTLTHAQFRVMVLLAAEYSGKNNGAVGITETQARDAGIGSDNTLYSALHELERRGLIQMTHPASRVPPRPTMYALTWRPIDDTDYSQRRVTAPHTYRDWQPEVSS